MHVLSFLTTRENIQMSSDFENAFSGVFKDQLTLNYFGDSSPKCFGD